MLLIFANRGFYEMYQEIFENLLKNGLLRFTSFVVVSQR